LKTCLEPNPRGTKKYQLVYSKGPPAQVQEKNEKPGGKQATPKKRKQTLSERKNGFYDKAGGT